MKEENKQLLCFLFFLSEQPDLVEYSLLVTGRLELDDV